MDWLQQFDPDPQWYIWTLHTITAISFPIYLVSMVCILRVNIVSNAIYKYLLASNVTMSYLTQLSLSAGTIPVLTLPGPGGYPVGLLTELGMPSCFQCAVVLSLAIANGLTTTMLFFYRSHMVMPFSRALFYGIIFVFVICGLVLPPVMNTILCETMDTNKAKENFQKTCPDIYALLPNYVKRDTLMIMELTFVVQVIFHYFGFLLLSAVVLIIVFNYRATHTLRRQIFSQATVRMHKTLVRCLIIQTVVYYSSFAIPSAVIILITGYTRRLPGLANIAVILLSLSDPAGVLALILAHKKYRRAVVRPFFKVAARDYNDVIYIDVTDKSKVCTGAEIIEKRKQGCTVMTDTLNITRRRFTDSLQELFHPVRLIQGHVWINDANVKKLHAFKNVWDIDIRDNVTHCPEWIKQNPEFQVENNPELTEIDLGSLVSYTSTFSQGFRIRNNGKYRMSWKQRDELYRMTNNRDLYDDIDMESVPPRGRSTLAKTLALVAYSILVPMIVSIFVCLLMQHCYRSADDVFTEVHSTQYEEVLEETKRAAGETDNKDRGRKKKFD